MGTCFLPIFPHSRRIRISILIWWSCWTCCEREPFNHSKTKFQSFLVLHRPKELYSCRCRETRSIVLIGSWVVIINIKSKQWIVNTRKRTSYLNQIASTSLLHTLVHIINCILPTTNTSFINHEISKSNALTSYIYLI